MQNVNIADEFQAIKRYIPVRKREQNKDEKSEREKNPVSGLYNMYLYFGFAFIPVK